MASKSPTSHRIGVPVPIRGRESKSPPPAPCRVTHAHFPTPAEALDLGWSPAQMMAECRRMPQEELTPKLQQRLLATGLTPAQVGELFMFSRKKINAMRAAAWEQQEFEKAREERNNDMGDPITFAKALVIGMPAREALEKCLPSTAKDITKELLQDCVEGGLETKEIARGFGISVNYLYNIASSKKIKLARPPRDTRTNNEEAGKGDTGADDGEKPPKTPPAEGAPPAAKPDDAGDDWAYTFGVDRPEKGPELIVYSDGRIMVRCVSLAGAFYRFFFNKDFSRCRIEPSPMGAKIRAKGKEGYITRIRMLATKLTETGATYPVKYRLNPRTLIGERVV